MVEADIAIKGGRVFYEGDFLEGGVAIVGDRISRVGKDSKLPSASEHINAEGRIIMPGLIDMESTLTPFETGDSESIYTLTRTAVYGGFTTIFLTPDIKPTIVKLSDLLELMEKAAGNTFVDLGVFGSLLPPSRREKLGKFVYGLWGSTAAINAELRFEMEEIIDAAKEPMKIPLLLRITDSAYNIGEPIGSNRSGIESFYANRPSSLEVSRIDAFLSKYFGSNKIALLRVSLPGSALHVKRFGTRGENVQCAVPAIYMYMTKKKAMKLGYMGLMSPPPREDLEVADLIQRVVNGDVTIVCSGHEPIPKSVKSEVVMPGVPTIDVTVRILLTLAKNGLIPLQIIPEVLSRRPAKFLGLRDRGIISEGYKADIIVIEHKKETVYDSRMSFNNLGYSPLDGEPLCGSVMHVFKRGKLIYEEGSFLSNFGSGKVLLRSPSDSKFKDETEWGLS